jgi:sulfatase modifying factor 1
VKRVGRMRASGRLLLAGVAALAMACQQRPASPPSPEDAAADAGDVADAIGEAASAREDAGAAEAAPPDLPPGCVHPQVEARCRAGYCEIPPGCFVMGSPTDEWGRALASEEPATVTLTHHFEIGQYELTQGEWTALGYPNPSGLLTNGTGDCVDDPRCPLGNVTWFEAVALANTLSQRHDPPLPPCYKLTGCQSPPGTGMTCASVELTSPTAYACSGYRLPTDAEWEYAARAGTRTAFYDGPITRSQLPENCTADATLERIAWYCHDAGPRTHPVGGKSPNAWGLYDVAGNAAEQVHDDYTGAPLAGPVTDPGGTLAPRSSRITRGGLFNSVPALCRSAARLPVSWDLRGPGLGLRLARTLP